MKVRFLSAATGVLTGLFAHHGLLFFLGCLEACHETALLFGFLGVFEHLLAHLVLVDAEAEDVGLHDGDEQRQEVVV